MTRQYAIAFYDEDEGNVVTSGTRYRDLETAEWVLAETYLSNHQYYIVFQDFTDWKRVDER